MGAGGRFAAALRDARLHAGLTQRELAELAGLSFRTVSDLERGVNAFPRRDTADMLADALRLPDDARAPFLAAARRRGPDPGSPVVSPPTQPGRSRALPPVASPLFGREAELAAVLDGLADPEVRLLTVTGPGGVGKTRLALQAARQAKGFDLVHAIRLDGVADPALVLSAIAAGIDAAPASTVAEQLTAICARLGGRSTLLLLDNLEHLLEAADDLVVDLGERAKAGDHAGQEHEAEKRLVLADLRVEQRHELIAGRGQSHRALAVHDALAIDIAARQHEIKRGLHGAHLLRLLVTCLRRPSSP